MMGIATLPETSDDLPLLDWLAIMARHQMSTNQLSLLTHLRDLAEQSRSLQPHLSEVERQVRRAVHEEVRNRAGHELSPISIQILVGAVYGAITMALDGEVPLSIPGSPPEDSLSIDSFLEITFNHLRNGF